MKEKKLTSCKTGHFQQYFFIFVLLLTPHTKRDAVTNTRDTSYPTIVKWHPYLTMIGVKRFFCLSDMVLFREKPKNTDVLTFVFTQVKQYVTNALKLANGRMCSQNSQLPPTPTKQIPFLSNISLFAQ